ncbi:MAG: hypothetical protein QW230_00010 [Thermofilum sp.]
MERPLPGFESTSVITSFCPLSCETAVKLSVFSFPDLTVSYGILQFDAGEDPSSKVHELSEEGLKPLIESSLKAKVTALSVAKGLHVYGAVKLSLTYLRVELEDGREYAFEIYGDSARSYSNTGAEDHYEVIVTLMRALVPGLKLPRLRVVGI